MAAKLVVVVFLAVAVGAFCLGVASVIETRRFVKCASRVIGEVAAYAEIKYRMRMYAPIIVFPLPTGGMAKHRGTTWSSYRQYAVGQRVPLLLSITDVEKRCVIDRGSELWFLGGFLIATGLGLAAICVFVLLRIP